MSLSDIDTPEAILKAIEEFDKLGRSEFLSRYGFGRSQTFFLLYKGKRYDSKAIVGVARKYAGKGLPPLTHKELRGGVSTVQPKLEELGFTVVNESVNPDWSADELREIVTDYLDMLQAELAGQSYNKTEHRKVLSAKLQKRSKGSIEFKHANVSSALAELGLPYIDGYKPREHSQAKIADFLDELLSINRELRALFEAKAALVVTPASLKEVQPPKPLELTKPKSKKRRAVRIDYQRREEQNRKLGLAGEKLVVEYEIVRLNDAGRSELADRVEHVALTQGDGLGYDVLSFDEFGNELYIEVKTTNGPPEAAFVVTSNELEFSEEESDNFALFRVFDFGGNARFYIRRGSLRDNFGLSAKAYLASPASVIHTPP